MTYKAYIVANKEQELGILEKFEQSGLLWGGGEKPTKWVPSKVAFSPYTFNFPYVISSGNNGKIVWFSADEITDETIVYDGRKEDDEVYTRYKVTQEFMNELIKWRDKNNLDFTSGYTNMFIAGYDIEKLPDIVDVWRTDADSSTENNNRLISILKWLNGEDVFEVEKPHKFVVRSNEIDEDGDYWYVKISGGLSSAAYSFDSATNFNTREEAQGWANSHQVVVEIDEEGNEVE